MKHTVRTHTGNALALTALAALVTSAQAQTTAPAPNLEAGNARAQAVCAACHGANGVSVSDAIPNLGGQRAAYLEAQLRAFKSGTRKAALMNAMAAQLTNEDIVDVAAHFASQAPASVATKSDLLPALGTSKVRWPEGYEATFTKYATVNRPDINQVRDLWANPVAVAAAREGRPLPDGSVLVLEQHAAKLGPDRKPVAGADGFFERDRLVAYAVMERAAGWGKDIPEMLRNDDWQYAVFTPAKQMRPAVNQAECLACHKPLDKASYTFTVDKIAAAKKP